MVRDTDVSPTGQVGGVRGEQNTQSNSNCPLERLEADRQLPSSFSGGRRPDQRAQTGRIHPELAPKATYYSAVGERRALDWPAVQPTDLAYSNATWGASWRYFTVVWNRSMAEPENRACHDAVASEHR